MLFPTLLFTRYVYHNNMSSILRVRIPSFKEIGAFVIGLILLTPLLQNFLYIQNFVIQKLAASSPLVKNMTTVFDKLDKLLESTYGNLLTSHSIFEGSFVIFVVAVIPALCEETLFRGLVQKSFELKLKPFWAILITSVFFGFYHFSPYGLFALIALGAYFGFAAYVSNSIIIAMVLHFTNNFISALAFILLGSEELIRTSPVKYDSIYPQLISFVMFTTLFFAYIIFVKTNYHKLLPKHEEEL
jgi:membrane protease YdiL (CAAX protease family)